MKELSPSFKGNKVDAVPEQARHTVSRMEQGGSVIRLFGVDLSAAKSRSGSSRASTIERTPQFDVNYNTEKRQTGDASTSSANAEHGIEQSKTHCLLFEKNLPEFLFLFCLQCLEIGEKEERYLISNPHESDRQWVVRYTSSETPEGTMQNCGSLCGNIKWGSSAHCDAVHIDYTTTLSDLPLDSISILEVKYPKLNKQDCLRCVSFNLHAINVHNGDDDMHSIFAATTQAVQLKWNDLLKTCKTSKKCSGVKDKSSQISSSLSEFRSIKPLSHKGGDSFSGRETTPTYLCMHYTSRGVLPADTCKECIKEIIDSKHSRSQKGETRIMSRKSGLIFLTEKLPVQKVALQCDEFCDWVSGLTEDVCRLLQNIETMNSGDSQVPGQKVEEYHFVTAITYLSTKPVTSHLWYLQFKQGEGDMEEAFKDLAFCIAVVSNAYVVSVRLRYLIMSPFDYKHVATICNIPDIIRITHFDNVYSGIFPQPLSLQSITSSLGISGHTGPKIFISDRLEQ